jgi:hypothetical protein
MLATLNTLDAAAEAIVLVNQQRQQNIIRPHLLDFVPYPMLAITLSRAELAVVVRHRGAPQGAEMKEFLYNAMRTCNIGVVQYLFESKLLLVGFIKREFLSQWIQIWAYEQANGNAGAAMFVLMLRGGLDMRSPIGAARESIWTIVARDCAPESLQFLNTYCPEPQPPTPTQQNKQ